MKKALVLVVPLSLAAAGGVWLLGVPAMTPPAEEVVCTRLVDVCGADGDGWSECTDDVGRWMAKHPVETAELATCVTDADSCSGVTGCMAGAGLRSLGNGAGEFFRGMGKTLGL